MKKQVKALLMLGLTLLMLVSFTSCENLVETLVSVFVSDVSGSVVNAMADDAEAEYWKGSGTDTLEGATLSFYRRLSNGTYSTTATTTARVTSSGNFYVGSLSMGEYKIQGAQTGWTFVPRYVDISGEDMTVPPVIAYPNQGANTLVILASWESTSLDLDSILTYFDGGARNYVGYLHPPAGGGSGITTAFSQTGAIDSTGDATMPISRPRDIQSTTPSNIPRVETIIIEWSTSAPYYNTTATDSVYGIDVARNQLRYYLNCFSSSLSLTGLDDVSGSVPFSGAQVDIMFTDSSLADTHYGGWAMPWNTAEKTLNVANISVISNGFVIYSGNGAIYNQPDGNFYMRSAGDSDSGVVTVDVLR